MEKIFINYIQTFPFIDNIFYFHNFTEISKDTRYIEFQKFLNWVKNNNFRVTKIIEEYADIIKYNNKQQSKEFNKYRKSLIFDLPSVKMVTEGTGFFDEGY